MITVMPSYPVTVFIVDDSPQLTEMLGELIVDPGRVEIAGTADSAQRAIDDIHRLNPDMVIVDLQLKDGNGFDVVKAIRSLPNNENTVIVLFTNHLAGEFRNHAMKLGADFFLDKSRDHARIVDLIREKVRQRGA